MTGAYHPVAVTTDIYVSSISVEKENIFPTAVRHWTIERMPQRAVRHNDSFFSRFASNFISDWQVVWQENRCAREKWDGARDVLNRPRLTASLGSSYLSEL